MRSLASALLLSLLAPGCDEFEPLEVLANADSKGLECTTIEELFALPEKELDIGRAALVIQDGFAEGLSIDSAIDALDELARGCGQPNEPDLAVEALRRLDYLAVAERVGLDPAEVEISGPMYVGSPEVKWRPEV